MPTISYIDNDLNEGVLLRFAATDNYDLAVKSLNNLAKKWNMRFVKDESLFGGYYVREDGICYFVK